MDSVSRDLIRAVLETRDRRHNETHSVMIAMFQGLVVELVEQGALAPAPLASRLDMARAHIGPAPHGSTALAVLDHVTAWLRSIGPGLPVPHPERWTAPESANSS